MTYDDFSGTNELITIFKYLTINNLLIVNLGYGIRRKPVQPVIFNNFKQFIEHLF